MNWTDNVVMRGLGRVCDFILLNILWIVCSIPLFTIGASTTALYTVMLKLVKNEEGYIVKGFLIAFKENFKKSTLLWLILGAVGLIIGADLRFAAVMEFPMSTILQSIFMVLGIVWLSVVIYAFPLTARYENTIKNTIKNALLLSIVRLPYTIVLLVLTVGPVVLTLLDTRTLLIGIALWLAIGGAVVAWMNSFILRKVFEIFKENEETNDNENEVQ